MPIGIIANCSAVFLGGLSGCLCGKFLSEEIQKNLTIMMGFCAIAIGINSIIKTAHMAPVVIAVLLGMFLGGILKLEKNITNLFAKILHKLPAREEFSMENYITCVVLFCASGFGIYGVMMIGINGDNSILLSKTVLDFFTAMIFAITLKLSISIIAFPMLAIQLALLLLSRFIAPVATGHIFQNFIACGGILTMAAGLRVSGIKSVPIANLVPALVLVIPLSYFLS